MNEATIFLALFGTGAGIAGIALYTVIAVRLDQLEETIAVQRRLMRAIKASAAALVRRNQIKDVNESMNETLFVTCGGCGKSVATFDSFNPIPHGCEALTQYERNSDKSA